MKVRISNRYNEHEQLDHKQFVFVDGNNFKVIFQFAAAVPDYGDGNGVGIGYYTLDWDGEWHMEFSSRWVSAYDNENYEREPEWYETTRGWERCLEGALFLPFESGYSLQPGDSEYANDYREDYITLIRPNGEKSFLTLFARSVDDSFEAEYPAIWKMGVLGRRPVTVGAVQDYRN